MFRSTNHSQLCITPNLTEWLHTRTCNKRKGGDQWVIQNGVIAA